MKISSPSVASLFFFLPAAFIIMVASNAAVMIGANAQNTQIIRRAFRSGRENEPDSSLLRRRSLKSGKGGGGPGGPLQENLQCVDFDHPAVQEALDKLDNDDECREENACGGGCCRYHDEDVICDTSNAHPFMACICNDNTADRDTPVAAPIDIGPVEPTTPAPTTSPTTPQPIGGGYSDPSDACMLPTVFQDATTKNCTAASDCQNYADPESEEPTCCWKGVCTCMPFDSFDAQCVPSP
mmetsp:Transcript_17780/g.50397  ORF Transcript_17780/g.50397 Transcript_17780/m.50397 type:complete len:240 (-) Transcript_17780:272-991(-)|eukprot:CAMPEP_0119546718 /NCGR_PEP_ID=MMETSP1352-20130426/1013_1 /TAXON_ID=265584 /ORGANISM="Stauroneis constricta, Strain CCMP1120" /LENGTH=239 /DNA_ID=CAMNT_0007591443 /DNA_START=287 /DNA_END=1006 /DNA_ORIENTATION=-